MIAASSWLIEQLDKPFVPGATPVSYQMGSDEVQVYYLHNIASLATMKELLAAIRTQTQTSICF